MERGFMSPIVDQLMEGWDDIVTELDDKMELLKDKVQLDFLEWKISF